MKVVAVCSRKGGAGRTTICGHLGVEAGLKGHGPVALVDTDPQGSLAAWWNEREAAEPVFARVEFASLAEHLRLLSEAGVKLVIIDTPRDAIGLIEKVMAVSDLILIPTRPSPHDLRAVGSTIDIAESEGKRIVFVINGAVPGARITAEAAIVLSQHGPVAPVTLHERIDFSSSMIDGRTAQELDPESRSAAEIAGLWSYLERQLSRLTKCAPAWPPSTPNNRIHRRAESRANADG